MLLFEQRDFRHPGLSLLVLLCFLWLRKGVFTITWLRMQAGAHFSLIVCWVILRLEVSYWWKFTLLSHEKLKIEIELVFYSLSLLTISLMLPQSITDGITYTVYFNILLNTVWYKHISASCIECFIVNAWYMAADLQYVGHAFLVFMCCKNTIKLFLHGKKSHLMVHRPKRPYICFRGTLRNLSHHEAI